MLWVISVQAPHSVAHSISEALDTFSFSTSLFEDEQDQNIWHVKVLTDSKPVLDELEQLIHTICAAVPTIKIEEVPEKDWIAENQRSFEPRTIGQFYVHDTYHQDDLPHDKIGLQIDASTAFGTGHHGTTQGCLEALQTLHQDGYKFKNVIDIGTGTGILAIGCAKLFEIRVLATDNDPEAIHKAEENIQLNDCQSQVKLFIADGLTDPVIISQQSFDLVIANILANTLIDLAPHIADGTCPGSVLILSGLLQAQAENVASVYLTYGFTLKQMILHDEWMTLVLSSNLI
jgi:ribosomal protein L11 methyltransferase